MAKPTVTFDEAIKSYVIGIVAANSGGAGVAIKSYEIQVQAKNENYLTPTSCNSLTTLLGNLYCKITLSDIVLSTELL